jgi:hypothetical protein
MTYYNEVKKKSYKCFLCGRENGFVMDYVVDTENVELNQPSYHVLGGEKYVIYYKCYNIIVSTHSQHLKTLLFS